MRMYERGRICLLPLAKNNEQCLLSNYTFTCVRFRPLEVIHLFANAKARARARIRERNTTELDDISVHQRSVHRVKWEYWIQRIAVW